MRRLWIGTTLALLAGLLLATGALAQEVDPVEVEFTGTVTDIALGTFTAETETGEVFTVVPPEGFDLAGLEVGDIVEVDGTLAEDGSVLATSVVVQEPDDDETDKGEVGYFCLEDTEMQHPVGAGIAETYGVEYDQVMAWFCDGGFGFGQIMLALMTQDQTGTSADETLARRAGGEGWGEIWISMELIGKPSEINPPGAPENADAGPPFWAGGPPEGAGRPEDAGPPDWAGGKPPGAGGPPGGGDNDEE
ncbi:MAG: DUF5666 domain-containing protein [Anaerolineales bacterium]